VLEPNTLPFYKQLKAALGYDSVAGIEGCAVRQLCLKAGAREEFGDLSI
jgi:hypothetical protein